MSHDSPPERGPNPNPDDGRTRRSFLRAATVAAAGTAAALTAPEAHANRIPEGFFRDRRAEIITNFRDTRRHENDHVAFLLQTLGSKARPKPNFRNLIQANVTQFARLSQTFENTGTGAYLNAAPCIKSRAVLASAGSIALVEARHAGWLNTLLDDRIAKNVFGAEQSFERPVNVAEVVQLVTPFINNLNGGPPLTFGNTPSDENDCAILNFALALEFLEQEFYNINVPRLIG